jgi:hypothetical protein
LGAALAGGLITLAISLPLAAAEPLPRGDPAARLSSSDEASEYWDLLAAFESGHRLFVRFMITNEGPGSRTGIAYGHFIEPDGTTHWWKNGRREANWTLGPRGRTLEVGSSDLYLTGPPYRLHVRKKKKGIDIDLRITPAGSAVWNAHAPDSEPAVDVLASAADVEGKVWFRAMDAPVELSGRAGMTHTWMERSETDLMRRRIDFYSLHGDTQLYLYAATAPDGAQTRWLRVAREGETLFESKDFEINEAGRSVASEDPEYPLPAVLTLSGKSLAGRIELGVGVLHYDPMEVIPQPFRFLLSLKMRPQRVWTESSFEVTVTPPGADPVRIRGSGIANVTFLNPAPSPASNVPHPPGE